MSESKDSESAIGEPVVTEIEDGYHTVTLQAYDGFNWEKMQPIGWYSVYGGEINGEPLGPQPDMRTGYQRLRSWFWSKVHRLSKERGYCGEDDCC